MQLGAGDRKSQDLMSGPETRDRRSSPLERDVALIGVPSADCHSPPAAEGLVGQRQEQLRRELAALQPVAKFVAEQGGELATGVGDVGPADEAVCSVDADVVLIVNAGTVISVVFCSARTRRPRPLPGPAGTARNRPPRQPFQRFPAESALSRSSASRNPGCCPAVPVSRSPFTARNKISSPLPCNSSRCGHWAFAERSCSERTAWEMTAMELYAALDVALDETAICVVDREVTIVLEAKVGSDAATIAEQLQPYAPFLRRIGLEAGPLHPVHDDGEFWPVPPWPVWLAAAGNTPRPGLQRRPGDDACHHDVGRLEQGDAERLTGLADRAAAVALAGLITPWCQSEASAHRLR